VIDARRPARDRTGRRAIALGLALAFGVAGSAGLALDSVVFRVDNAPEALTKALRGASVLLESQRAGNMAPQDLFADARAEYGRLLGELYAQGYYSAVISVKIDGREAAEIPPIDSPDSIGSITVQVDPGPRFSFSRAEVTPLAPGTDMPEGFAPGQPAESGVIGDAVQAGVDGWRDKGRAKAAPVAEDIVADHATAELDARVTLDPGPVLRFGRLKVEGNVRMREQRIRWISSLRTGDRFDPAELERAADRLRRTGVFSSVTLTEDEAITAPDIIGITATLVEAKPRRYSFGAEIASLDGVTLSGLWLHRNLFGGGERLTVEGEVTNIGLDAEGVDYSLGVSLERPGTPGPDTSAALNFDVSHLDEDDYLADTAAAGVSFTHVFSEKLSARAGLSYEYTEGRDDVGNFLYRSLALPLGGTWDNRDNPINATGGVYAEAEAKPFLGFGTTDNGVRMTLDARGYRPLDRDRRFVIAGRLQAGAVFGADLLDTPRADLFYSGGGGTVRGQPYQSLGVTVDSMGTPLEIGGTKFIGGSVEVRAKVSDKIGLVGFFDYGRIDAQEFFGNDGNWHSGAGIGARYETGFGPIRFDVATPLGGDTGEGVQFYIGLGQAF
jgi:translocation and assembly module TamA